MPAPFDLGSMFWMAMTIISVIVSVTLFLVHEFVLMPSIARAMRKARWSKGVVAFIQDDTGNVVFCTSDKELPEGVIHNQRGWFLLPRPGAVNLQESVKRGPGRPPKTDGTSETTTEKDIKENVELYGKMLHVPTLRGLGKQIFFGATSSAMLTNLFTLSHADLLEARRLIPMNTQKTQLDALATGSRIEGMKMMGGDLVKWIFYVILAVIPIAVIALVFWFLKG